MTQPQAQRGPGPAMTLACLPDVFSDMLCLISLSVLQPLLFIIVQNDQKVVLCESTPRHTHRSRPCKDWSSHALGLLCSLLGTCVGLCTVFRTIVVFCLCFFVFDVIATGRWSCTFSCTHVIVPHVCTFPWAHRALLKQSGCVCGDCKALTSCLSFNRVQIPIGILASSECGL
jgi:hypothetical protein